MGQETAFMVMDRAFLRSVGMQAISIAFACASLALASCSPGGATKDSAPVAYTKDRLSDERMEALVAEPIKLAREGDLEAAKTSFEALRSQTKGSKGNDRLAVADLLTAFGVKLYVYGQESDDERFGLASLPYLREAIDAYKAALGPHHPEIAVALNSYADAVTETKAPVPPDEVEAYEREAMDIRLASFGEANSETRSSMASLANYLSSQAKSPSDRYAVEAEKLYRQSLAIATRDGPSGPDTSVSEIRLDLARLYALDPSPDRSLQEADLAEKVIQRQSDPGPAICIRYNSQRERLVDSLEANGHRAAANLLVRKGARSANLEC